MRYKKFCEECKDLVRDARDIEISVNGEDPIDETYYPEIESFPVVGFGNMDGVLKIDLVCPNWDERFNIDWVPAV